MLNPVYCSGCGQRLEVPAGFTKAKLRCAECGVFNELPKEVREAAAAREEPPALVEPPPRPQPAKPQAALDDEDDGGGAYTFQAEPEPAKPAVPKPAVKKPRPKRVADDDAPREVLIRGTEDDDGNPYQVTGDVATRRCPECDKKVDVRSAVCTHCGYNFDTGEKKPRAFQPIDEEWEAGWPFQKRLSLFVVLQVVNFLMLVASLIQGWGFGASFSGVLITVGLQAFLVGTYERLNLRRTEKGKVTLLHTWRYAFLARPTEPVKWKEHEGVTITRDTADIIEWVFVIILLGYGCLPGILFWWFVVRPDKYTVALTRDHGTPTTPIFRTSNEDRAFQVRDRVSEITTLPVQK